jgi:hypothetical protein
VCVCRSGMKERMLLSRELSATIMNSEAAVKVLGQGACVIRVVFGCACVGFYLVRFACVCVIVYVCVCIHGM